MYKLVWEENFEKDGMLNDKKWDYFIGCPHPEDGELEYYTKRNINNAYISEGKLHIRAQKEIKNNCDYTSAKVRTKQSWKYGKIEIRAKLPLAKGSWPAIWMMPKGSKEEDWPLCGEIDIMEHVAQNLGQIHFSLHTEKYNWLKDNKYTSIYRINELVYNFNVYSMEWTENEIRMYINDKLCFNQVIKDKSEEIWPFDKEFYLILSLAVGGWGGLEGIDDNWPQELIIDYIKVYQEKQKAVQLA